MLHSPCVENAAHPVPYYVHTSAKYIDALRPRNVLKRRATNVLLTPIASSHAADNVSAGLRPTTQPTHSPQLMASLTLSRYGTRRNTVLQLHDTNLVAELRRAQHG